MQIKRIGEKKQGLAVVDGCDLGPFNGRVEKGKRGGGGGNQKMHKRGKLKYNKRWSLIYNNNKINRRIELNDGGG